MYVEKQASILMDSFPRNIHPKIKGFVDITDCVSYLSTDTDKIAKQKVPISYVKGASAYYFDDCSVPLIGQLGKILYDLEKMIVEAYIKTYEQGEEDNAYILWGYLKQDEEKLNEVTLLKVCRFGHIPKFDSPFQNSTLL